MTSKVVIGVIGAVVAVGTAIGVGVVIPSAPTRTTVTVPATYGGNTIANDCSSDATAGLSAFFASLAANTTVNFPSGACYQVSPGVNSILGISGTTGLTLNGNGSKFQQYTYLNSAGANACTAGTGDIVDPVLLLNGNTNLTVNDLTLEGVNTTGGTYACPGTNGNFENNAGIIMGRGAAGDQSDTFNGVTIENTNGDSLDLGQPGITSINKDIVFENGTLSNWGWYGIVPEAVNGFNFTGNTATGGGFMDVEVDNPGCTNSLYACLGGSPNGTPSTIGIWNMSVVNNTIDAAQRFITNTGPQGCVPQKNWTAAGNTFTGSGAISLDGSNGNTMCPNDNTGFVYTDNTGPGPPSVCGSGGPPQPCAGINLDAWANVDISNNSFQWAPTTTSGSERTVTDGATTSGSTTITSATANFTSADVCGTCAISISNYTNGAYTIVSVTNSTTAVVSTAAPATATGVTLGIGAKGTSSVNSLSMEAVGLCSVTGATVRNNDFNNGYGLWNTTSCVDTGNSTIVTTGVTTCGNTWGLTNPQAYWSYNNNSWSYTAAPAANPQTDSNC